MPEQVLVDFDHHRLAALQAGDRRHPALVLLHGWPLTSAVWQPVIEPLAADHHVLAFDLPGIAQSASPIQAPTRKAEIAQLVLDAAQAAGARDITIAGGDVGGMIAFAAARDFADRIRGAVIMNTVIPGLDPWRQVLTDERVWHFAFHLIRGLPEKLVTGHERVYFDYFIDTLSAHPEKIDDALRRQFVLGYTATGALKTGFGWYRAMPADARHNSRHQPIDTPILYLRGDADRRPIAPYVDGLKAAGASDVRGSVIKGSGELLSIEAPKALIACLREFTASLPAMNS